MADSRYLRPGHGRPIKIIEMYRPHRQIKLSKYSLKLEELKRHLEPIKNTEVVVIAIVGPSRRGKSFVLNYMSRFLSDPKNIDWMGKGDEPLEGFEWQSCGEPVTFGIWLSKPFILKQSNGKEIAVLLMDTQGLFDDEYEPRDWSTIVGISLLVSSCLVVNVFTDLSNEILEPLNSYINYGLRVNEVNENETPFQNLLFLIRDWNIPNEHKYGMSGGEQYLEKKMIVRESQSIQSQNVRNNMRKCFKDINCFLMPPFGDVMEHKDFNGSVKQLKFRFKDKLKEFITKILNPEELVPKMIAGNPITGDELCQQFKSVVDLFNREELPQSQDIMDANAKLSDNISIRKLRDLHLSQLRGFIQSKSFVTRRELREQNDVYKSEKIEDFESSMKSNDSDLYDKLYDTLKKTYEIIFEENEKRREKAVEESVHNCSQLFMNAINEELKDNKFVESEHLEELFKSNRKKAFDSFNLSIDSEDKQLFGTFLLDLTLFINNFESVARTSNYRKIKEFEDSKEGFVKKVVNAYNNLMENLLNDCVYLSQEEFKHSESVIRSKIENKFKTIYDFRNPVANENFYLKIDKNLKESKKFFKEKNQKNCETIVENTQTIALKSIQVYNQEMTERLELINSIESLDKFHKSVEQKAAQVLNTCPFKAPYFFDRFVNYYNTEINKIYKSFETKITDRELKYKTAFEDARTHYIKEMTEEIEMKGIITTEVLNRLHRSRRRSALQVYETHFESNTRTDPLFKSYQSDLRNQIDEDFDNFEDKCRENERSDENRVQIIFNQSINSFNANMNQFLESAISETEFLNNYHSLKERIIKEMSENDSILDKSLLKTKVTSLEKSLNKSFIDFNVRLEKKKDLILKDYENRVIQSKNNYKQKIEEMLKNSEYLTDEELDEFHKSIEPNIISELKSYLKPAFDLQIETFIKRSEQLIEEEYQTYIVVNTQIRNNKMDLIKSSSNKYITEYQLEINTCFDSINSDNELHSKHEHLLDNILDKCKNSNEFSNKIVKSVQLALIENEIMRLFNDNLNKYLVKVDSFEKTFSAIFEDSKQFYETRMDTLFENNELIWIQELNKYQMDLQSDTLKKFEEQLQGSGATFDQLNIKYTTQLLEFIDDLEKVYNEKNTRNKELFEEKLKDIIESIQQKYLNTMNQSIDSLMDENALNKKHYDLMENLLTEFNDGIHIMDMDIQQSYQQKLQSFMSSELIKLNIQLNARIDEIIKSYKSVSTRLANQYIEEMAKIVDSTDLFTDKEFETHNSVQSNEVIDKFENHLREKSCSEAQTYFIRFKQTIEDEFIKIYENFIIKRDSRKQKLEIMVREFDDNYVNEMKTNQKSIRSLDELKLCHQRVKEKIIEDFSELSQLRASSQLNLYIERLIESFKNSLLDFEDLLGLRLEKEETLTKNLRLDFRRHYKKEMDRFFQSKLYVKKPLLNKTHKILLRNTTEKFESEKGHLSHTDFVRLAEESVTDIFNKIEEENEMRRPTDSIAIGIDLGTTNSCVAFYNSKSRNANNVIVIPNEFGQSTTPSVVSYRSQSVLVIGDVAKDDIHAYHRNTISSAKRLIGRNFSDQSVQNNINLWSYKVVDDGNNKPMVEVNVDGTDQRYNPEQISARVLRKMKEIAQNHLGCDVNKAVITVPAYFDDGQREATKHAGQLAGLEVLRIVNEPTAAAIAFKVDRNDEREIRKVLIYDFGGGTFDVSVLEINRGQINVLAVGGDNYLGGDDIDTNIIKYCLEEFNVKLEGSEGEESMSRLRHCCEIHKKRLSSQSVESTVISIDKFYQNKDLRVVLTRDLFEELNNELFVRTIDLVKSTLQEKAIEPSDIDDIVLVGGSTRIHKIQTLLSQAFNGRPLNHSVNPDEAVAKGAAIQAALLNGQQSDGLDDLELKDVSPHSLGIRIKGGKMSVIIPRNTTVPTKVTKQYYTSEDNQTSVAIRIYEGEKHMADDNHLLGKFELQGIPPRPMGEEPIDVTIDVNDEGILHVKAKLVSTGNEEEIEIKENKGRMTQEMIQRILEQEN